MSFHDRLKEARRCAQLSQEELAELLNVSRQAVGKWEQGLAYPEMEKLIALCAVLNVSTDELLADELSNNCRRTDSAPAPAGSILILAENGTSLVRCVNVLCSQRYKTRRGPKYALFGVSEHSSVWGPNNTFLGWYADEASVRQEMQAIREAMIRGDADYTLQYNAKVRKKLGRIELINE